MAALDPIETLRRVPFFAVLPPDELRALAAHCVVRRLRRDEMLFAEGDSCGGLFVVQAGAVKQFKMAETGREQVRVTERAGSTVGELALFDGGSFPASAAAVEDSTVLYLPKREFLDVCRHNSGVAFAVIRSLASRSRYLTSLVEEFPLEETNQEIGAEIGTVRDLVSRNLRRLVDRRIIKMERRKVIVLDMPELEAQIAGTKRATVEK